MTSEDRRKRKNPEEIIEGIFTVLDSDRPKNVTEISEQAGCSWEAASKYLNLVYRVQRGPKIHYTEIGNRNAQAWRKEYGRLPEH